MAGVSLPKLYVLALARMNAPEKMSVQGLAAALLGASEGKTLAALNARTRPYLRG